VYSGATSNSIRINVNSRKAEAWPRPFCCLPDDLSILATLLPGVGFFGPSSFPQEVKNKWAQIKNFITIPNENGIASFKHFHSVRRAWRGRERRFHKTEVPRESWGIYRPSVSRQV
jgi:hypothetical protein